MTSPLGSIDAMRLALFIITLLCACAAHAQQFPSRPVRLIVPFPAGSTPDIVGRALGQKLTAAWGQPVIVDNKPGAGANIGTAEAAKAPADGYTLLIGSNGPIAINKVLYERLPFDPDRDLTPISLLAGAPQILAVHPGVPAADLRQLIDYARANPDKLSYGSVGSGSASHLTMELFKSQANVSLVHIPYKGFPPVVTDLLSGNIQATFAIVPAVLPQIRAGKLKALAVTSEKRTALAPDIPTVAEQGLPQFDATAWQGLLAPRGIPPDALARISTETRKAMQSPEVKELLGKQGFEVVGSSPEEFAAFIRAESAKWGAVVKATGAKAE
jgi:tripartite-type tricarboxylate transporter receptor subunit TctC